MINTSQYRSIETEVTNLPEGSIESSEGNAFKSQQKFVEERLGIDFSGTRANRQRHSLNRKMVFDEEGEQVSGFDILVLFCKSDYI